MPPRKRTSPSKTSAITLYEEVNWGINDRRTVWALDFPDSKTGKFNRLGEVVRATYTNQGEDGPWLMLRCVDSKTDTQTTYKLHEQNYMDFADEPHYQTKWVNNEELAKRYESPQKKYAKGGWIRSYLKELEDQEEQNADESFEMTSPKTPKPPPQSV